jgi:hypothetical protein
MPEIGPSGLMSGQGKRGDAAWPKLPPLCSTLPLSSIRRLDLLSGRSQRTHRTNESGDLPPVCDRLGAVAAVPEGISVNVRACGSIPGNRFRFI